MRLRRRWIPILISGFIGAVWIAALQSNVISDRSADQLTLLNIAIGYLGKDLLFAYMRHRMVRGDRPKTVFGYALIDFFSGLIVLAAIMVAVSTIVWAYSYTDDRIAPLTVRLYTRTGIIVGIWLVMTTGAAVAWEMHKVKSDEFLRVHVDEVNGL